MELADVTQLVKLLDKSGLTELRFNDGTSNIVLKKEVHYGVAPVAAPMMAPVSAAPTAPVPVSAVATAPEKTASKFKEVTSPMVGTFYASASPGSEPFVKAGSSIKAGQVVCVIEAMKIMNEIESDLSGEIVEVCVDNETPVEYGTVLFRVRPA